MNRLPFILSSIALGVLAAGCATESGITSAPAPAVVTPPPAAAAPVTATPTYSVGAAGTTIVVPPASPAVTVAPSPAASPLRVGFGRIESIMVVPSAAAGGTAPNRSKRIAMRMDNGTVQHFDTLAEGLTVGDRIEITTNGTMRHPA